MPEMTGVTFILNRMTLRAAGNLWLWFVDLPSCFNYVRMEGPRVSRMPCFLFRFKLFNLPGMTSFGSAG
jgi:hypothetical protein